MRHSESYFLLYLAFISHSHRPFPLHGVKFKRTEWLTFQGKGLCWVQRIALCVEATKVIYVGGEEMSLQKVFPKGLKRDIETNCYSSITHACVCAQSLPSLCDPLHHGPQDPLSVGFSRQEYWSGLPCPPPGHLPDPRIKPVSPASPALQAVSLLLSHLGSPPSIITKAFGGRSTTRDWPPLNVDCPESTVKVLTLK